MRSAKTNILNKPVTFFKMDPPDYIFKIVIHSRSLTIFEFDYDINVYEFVVDKRYKMMLMDMSPKNHVNNYLCSRIRRECVIKIMKDTSRSDKNDKVKKNTV